MAIVYAHYRKTDNEIFYIGIGKKKSRPYSREGRNKYWKHIVDKCGYSVEILADNLTWEQACEIEMYLISFYGREDLGLGPLVNMTDGGEGSINPSIDSIDRSHVNYRKPVLQYDMEGNLIREWPSITSANKKLNLSNVGDCCKNRPGCKSVGGFIWRYKDPNKWFPPTYVNKTFDKDVIKNRVKNTDYEKLHAKRVLKILIPILQYTMTGEFLREWDSAKSAGEFYNLSKSAITKCCRGKTSIKSVGGFIWRYKDPEKWFPVIYTDGRSSTEAATKRKGHTSFTDPNKLAASIAKRVKNTDYKSIANKRKKPVIQLTVDGKVVKEWDSAIDASKSLGIDNSWIGKCCNGKAKTVGGFKWKYKN